jgi:deazaflavin-dependent oxidoreductase (nitroreductase family)
MAVRAEPVPPARRARGPNRRRAEPQYLYLTTMGRRSGRPREIEIWFTRRRDCYYLVAEHGERAQWVRNLRVEPAVQVRVGTRVFSARARVVDAGVEPALAQAVRRGSERKYGWGDGLVVELRPV